MTTGDFVGAGWRFPVGIGPRGGIALARGADEIDAAIAMILRTAPGERVMRPEFGCAMWDQVFEGTDANNLGLIAQHVRDALGRWEPRIDVVDVTVETHADHPERVVIHIAYEVRGTNDRRNLVHPFYVIPREEVGP